MIWVALMMTANVYILPFLLPCFLSFFLFFFFLYRVCICAQFVCSLRNIARLLFYCTPTCLESIHCILHPTPSTTRPPSSTRPPSTETLSFSTMNWTISSGSNRDRMALIIKKKKTDFNVQTRQKSEIGLGQKKGETKQNKRRENCIFLDCFITSMEEYGRYQINSLVIARNDGNVTLESYSDIYYHWNS